MPVLLRTGGVYHAFTRLYRRSNGASLVVFYATGFKIQYTYAIINILALGFGTESSGLALPVKDHLCHGSLVFLAGICARADAED